jgi:hypothetical protein
MRGKVREYTFPALSLVVLDLTMPRPHVIQMIWTPMVTMVSEASELADADVSLVGIVLLPRAHLKG